MATIVLVAAVGARWLALSAPEDDSNDGAQPRLKTDAEASAEPIPPPSAPVPIGDAVAPLIPESTDPETLSFRCEGAVLDTWESQAPPSGARESCTIIAIDWLDRPVAGAAVHVWGDDHIESGHVHHRRPVPVGPFEYTTDASGRCEVSPPSYRPRVRIEKDGVGVSRWVDLGSPRDLGVQYRTVVVPVPPLARVRGQVLQPDGTPAAGIMGVWFGETKPEGALVIAAVDVQGRFELDLPAEKSVSLAPVVFMQDEARERRFALTPGGVCEAVLWLPARWAIRGTVLSPDGAPVGSDEAVVVFWPEDDPRFGSPVWFASSSVHTDEQGRFELLCPGPARGRLTVQGARISGLAEAPFVVVDVAHPQVEVELHTCEPATISGRVTDEAGGPLGGIHVLANPGEIDSRDLALSSPGPSQLYGAGKTETGNDGTFEIGGLHPDGLYTVMTWFDNGQQGVSAHGVPAGTRDLVLDVGGTLKDFGTLALVVSSSATEGRVDDFWITASAHRSDGLHIPAWYQRFRGTDGIASIDDRPLDATLDLLVQARGMASVFLEGVRVTAEGSTVRVILPEVAAMDVAVSNDGKAAAWAVVEAQLSQSIAEDRLRQPVTARGRADQTGHARLSGLEPGRYSITAWHGGRSSRRAVDLLPGGTGSVRIEMP
jgi:hypothetical protein